MISVLVPVHNAGPHLSATLSALLGAQDDTLEVVVCDDGSTDDSGRIAERYATADRRVRCFRQARAGAAAARNAAFAKSSCRSVMFLDADDFLTHGSLDAMARLARVHPDDVVHCSWAKFKGDPVQAVRGAPPLGDAIPGWLWIARAFASDYPTYPGCFVIPRDLINRLGGWDEQLSLQDDMEFFARILCGAGTIWYCADALFCYREGVPGSLSNTPGRASSESQWLATRLAVDHLLNANDTPATRAAAVRQLMLVSYAQYIAAPDISREAEDYARTIGGRRVQRPWLPGGTFRRVAQAVVGWKLALKLHAAIKRSTM